MYDTLEQIILCIQKYHQEVSEEWRKIYPVLPSLKQRCVCDITEDGELYRNILAYCSFLDQYTIEVNFELTSKYKDYIRKTRIKAPNSVESKIEHYKTEAEHGYGKVPVIKCVNDLFGVRVVLPRYIEYEEIQKFVKKRIPNVKCTLNRKKTYNAVHVYFILKNNLFPWELQIWNKEDENDNLLSHSIYKQDYTSWEQERQKGGN